jgi:hypothetical protein
VSDSEGAPDPEAAADAGAALDAAWASVQAHWDDDAAHKRFVALAMTLDRLPEAGRRYRAERERAEAAGDEARAASARKRIDALLAAATQRMLATRTAPDAPRRARARVTWIAVGVAAAIVAATVWQVAKLR